MSSVTKRGSKWYAMWRGADGRLRQRVTPARTKTEAQLYAREKERQAWRQREGLDPMHAEALRFGELLDWWWQRYGSKRRAYSKDGFRAFLEKHLAELRSVDVTPALAGEFADRLDRLLTAKEESKALSAQSLNHLRAAVFGMFERARDPKHRKWPAENPVQWVKRRKVPRSGRAVRAVLSRDEVLPVLAAFPEPSLERPWGWIAAACIYAGLRPGEALGLHKEDVDTKTWTMTVHRSWDAPLPKDGDQREVVVVQGLRPHLEEAMRASASERVFARPDGTSYTPDVRFALVDHLRRALGRAGVVTGYRYTCRRKGCGFKETRREATEAVCPRCEMSLWISPVPRKLRFYDLRHTYATLLRKARVDLGAVQRALGHSSPEITAAIYDHSELEDYRADVERALSFAPPPAVNATSMQGPESSESEGPAAVGIPEDLRGLQMVGATGFEPATTCTPTMTPGEASGSIERTGSQGLVITNASDPALAPRGAPAAPILMGDQAHFRRGNLPVRETEAHTLETIGRQVVEAVAAGDFELARALAEEAIRVRAGAPPSAERDLDRTIE